MSDFIQICWNSGTIDEARGVCRFLVQEGWVASANIVPWIEAIYLRDGLVETVQESRVVLKTRRSLFDRIHQVILDNTSYEVPEVTISSIEGGDPDFLTWMSDQTSA